MRFHLPALPGQPVTALNSSCAYTQKVRRFATMMHRRGHEVIVYGGGGFDGEATEYVDTYGDTEPIVFGEGAWAGPNGAVIAAIAPRLQPDDVILLIAGRCQQMIAAAFPDHYAVEFGIGYGGSFANFRVFESHSWMHTTYGAQGGEDPHVLDGNAYHAVIPNYFDPEEFPHGDGAGDYLLFVGRLIERKGVEAAVEVARATGLTLFLAGEGEYRPGEDEEGIEYLGGVGPSERAGLMGGARVLLAPTTYIEPFGGVVVEAAMCGTPAITTDWGAFTETVVHGVTGWRCRRIGEMVWAAENAGILDRPSIRERALALYSTDVVAGLYESYFAHLETLKGDGWYDRREAVPGLAHSA